jgi:glycosyltransferase involved in cell wall biosynthesis
VVQRDELATILSKHDILILPTFYPGEGYPGVIIEAFSVGLPVISTNWKNIPEIVNEGNGLLVPVRDSRSLGRAIQSIGESKHQYRKLATGAAHSFKSFDSDIVNASLIARLKEMCSNSEVA